MKQKEADNPTSQTLRRAKGDDLIRREMFFKNCKPTMMHSRKTDQKLNANKSALRREADAIRQALGMGQPAQYAGNYALVA